MNLNDMYPSKYLKAEDLNGHTPTVTIREVKMEEMKEDNGEKKHKPVLYFVGKEKGMVLAKVNAGAIKILYGDDTSAWIGKPILLRADFVQVRGETKLGLRVGAPQQTAQPVPAQPMAPAMQYQAPAPQPAPAPFEDESQIPF